MIEKYKLFFFWVWDLIVFWLQIYPFFNFYAYNFIKCTIFKKIITENTDFNCIFASWLIQAVHFWHGHITGSIHGWTFSSGLDSFR